MDNLTKETYAVVKTHSFDQEVEINLIEGYDAARTFLVKEFYEYLEVERKENPNSIDEDNTSLDGDSTYARVVWNDGEKTEFTLTQSIYNKKPIKSEEEVQLPVVIVDVRKTGENYSLYLSTESSSGATYDGITAAQIGSKVSTFISDLAREYAFDPYWSALNYYKEHSLFADEEKYEFLELDSGEVVMETVWADLNGYAKSTMIKYSSLKDCFDALLSDSCADGTERIYGDFGEDNVKAIAAIDDSIWSLLEH